MLYQNIEKEVSKWGEIEVVYSAMKSGGMISVL